MKKTYEQFIVKRFMDDRIFNVTPDMPFESFVNCFQKENPFFLVSELKDGRVAITPNIMFLPWYRDGFWPQNLFPQDIEYVTIRDATYPVIVTAHPLKSFDAWLKKFVTCVEPFTTQTLAQFIKTPHEFIPIKWEKERQFA